MCVKNQRRFACSPQTIQEGREFVRESLSDWGFDDRNPNYYDAVLIANELLANSVRACVESVDVELDGHRDHLDICVADDGPGSAAVVDRGPAAESGRGMRIIDALCDGWGEYPLESGGKQVRCRLALDPAPDQFTLGCTAG